jgi:disulfide oxidoreductase YuzD
MTNQNQCFNPRLIIVDHFGELINQIDIKTETLLENQSLSEETRANINEAREEQIEKIKEVKELNLNQLAQKFNEDEFRLKWSQVMDDNSLEYDHKIGKIKEELILYDCVLLDNENLVNGFDLLKTSWYHNQNDLEFLK